MKHWYSLAVALYGLLALFCVPSYAQQKLAVPVDPLFPPEVVCATEPATEQQMQTLPWYADTLYLVRYYDSLRTVFDANAQARTHQSGVEDVWLRIPVQFWVYTDGGVVGPGNVRLPEPVDFQNMIDVLNDDFRQNDVKVRFYLLCPRVENDPDAVTINNATELTLLGLRNKTVGAINIHVSQNVGALYNPVSDAIHIPRFIYTLENGPNTVTHEIGHYFGLEHTFIFCKTPCFREPVSRGYVWRPFCPQNLYPKTCAVTGDCLTDTPADHEDNDDDVTINTTSGTPVCTYTGDRRDFWNNRYRPDETNLMSYMPRRCRRTFSPQQRTVMLRNMVRRQQRQPGATVWSLQAPPYQTDRYEPDNAPILARTLPPDETQERSMQAVGCGPDTEDWVRLPVPFGGASSSYILEVADVPNFVNPLTSADFFTAVPVTVPVALPASGVRTTTGPALAVTLLSNSNGVRRYLLPCDLLNVQPAREVLVRLAGTGAVFGRYRLTFEALRPTVAGPASVCANTSATFSLNDVTPGAAAVWSTTSSGILTLPPNVSGPTITVTATGPGTTALVATVTDNGCTYEVRQSVYVGATQLYVGGSGDACQGGTVVFEATPINVTGPLTWSVQGQYGGQRPVTVLSPTSISFPVGFRVQDITVTVTGTDACTGQPIESTSGVRVQNCTDTELTLYPNPTADLVELSIAKGGNTTSRGSAGNDFTATIHNGQGQPVLAGRSIDGRLTLSTQRLQAGLYHVQAQFPDGRVVRRQLSVQR